VAQVAGLFGVRTGEGYYLTNTNASYIYAAFGDTPESIKETTDLDSLYDLWTGYTEDVDGYAIHLKELDRSDAIAAGHPEDKVDAFMRYTRRQNLMSIKQTRANVYTQYCLYSGVGTYGDDATMIYDAVTDPFGTLADAWVEQQDNQDLSNLWDLVNFVTDPGGAIVDEMVDQAIDQSSEMAKELEGTLKKLDAMIAQYS